MRRFCVVSAVYACLVLLSGQWTLLYADTHENAWALSYYQENDSPWQKPNNQTDRYYTHGVALGVTRSFSSTEPALVWPALSGVGFVVGQLMFTPEDLETADIVTKDRPYAGYLFVAAQAQQAQDNTYHHVRLDIGVIGPASGAGALQTWSHTHWGGTDPQGWHNQLPNQPSLQAWVGRKQRYGLGVTAEPNGRSRLHSAATGHALGLELIPHAEIALGTVYRHADLGALLRLGTALPNDFGPAHLSDLRYAATRMPPGFGWYAFSQATVRAVQHNIFISGTGFSQSHGVELRRGVAELKGGVSAFIRAGRVSFEAMYAQTIQTPEFVGQAGNHRFGTTTFTISLWN